MSAALQLAQVLSPSLPDIQLSVRHMGPTQQASKEWKNKWARIGSSPRSSHTAGSGRTLWRLLTPMCRYDALMATARREEAELRPGSGDPRLTLTALLVS